MKVVMKKVLWWSDEGGNECFAEGGDKVECLIFLAVKRGSGVQKSHLLSPGGGAKI